ncbi:MAG: YraN family protein [Acidaminococcus sp.]|jgi:putative endonuclease|nr:YraN family protein [Acidaminococcus sp.]MCI2099952.1 YraN family protein [Acidaminococcus sp.]MCI2114183.1 YraN family protein [Acidaminococcus sp.]
MYEPGRFGRWGEMIAARYLVQKGYQILERNYRTPRGEIDIIAAKGGVIVFVEVKSRRGEGFGRPAAAVTWEKQSHIRASARIYLNRTRQNRCRIRYDVLEILAEYGQIRINHLQNFSHNDY